MGARADLEAGRAGEGQTETATLPGARLEQELSSLARRLRGVGRRRGGYAAGAGLLLFAAACASRPERKFAPAGPDVQARALDAWTHAVARAESLGPARLLYEARVSQGLARVSGTLAVRTAPQLSATLTGPFGSALARYEEGALTGEGIRPLSIAPDELRALLAGAWPEPAPRVEGIDGEDALLVWNDSVSGVLSLSAERFLSLRVRRAEGAITAGYSGQVDPWPERIEIADARSGNKLRLVLIAREPS